MASSIFFNGRLISVPGSYSEVDASGLASIGLGAAGIVGVLGTAVGGRPVTEITRLDEFIRLSKPEQGRRVFRSGDLRESVDMLFNPARDPAIPGGAVEVVAMKVNPATKATAILSNELGPAIELESLDWGTFTNQINVTVSDGTVKGKLLTITFEDQVEAVDNIGDNPVFNLTYTQADNAFGYPNDFSYETITAEVLSDGSLIVDAVTETFTGFGNTFAGPTTPKAVQVFSADPGDTNVVRILGFSATDELIEEVLTLNGTTPVVGTQIFGINGVLGFLCEGAYAGNITLQTVEAVPATIDTLFTTQNGAQGIRFFGAVTPVANEPVTVSVDQGNSSRSVLVGKSPTGARQVELIKFGPSSPPSTVVTSNSWSEVEYITTGELNAIRQLNLTATALKTNPGTQSTMQAVANYVNSFQVVQGVAKGFALDLLPGEEDTLASELDPTFTPVDIFSPANPEFTKGGGDLVDWINANSNLVSASQAPGGGGLPDNTTAPVALYGGSEGVATATEYQQALDLLKRIRVNTIVPLTSDPAVHALVEAHCAYMGGIGRSERDAVVGLQNTALTGVPTKSEAKAQIVDLNSRHVRAVAQSIERFNTNGQRQEFPPAFLACVVAGMQAGSPVGEPLTYKFTNTLSFAQDASWNPAEDAEELVQAGLLFLETIEGVGRRVVRNITTHRTSNNLAFTEGSVNEAVNFAVYNFRTNLEFAVGRKGFTGTITAAKSVAANTLGLLVDAQVLVAYRSLTAELIVDTLEVEAEIAPVLPINFIKNTVHLVTIRQSAA